MLPLKAVLFCIFLILLAGSLLATGFITDDIKYIYSCIGIVLALGIYTGVDCMYRCSKKKDLPTITTEQPILYGMKKNKSDSDLELMSHV
jgi:hypothetical protein